MFLVFYAALFTEKSNQTQRDIKAMTDFEKNIQSRDRLDWTI